MKQYWHVYYLPAIKQYQLTDNCEKLDTVGGFNVLAIFQQFDMAYDYVTKMNGRNQNTVYSQWTVNR